RTRNYHRTGHRRQRDRPRRRLGALNLGSTLGRKTGCFETLARAAPVKFAMSLLAFARPSQTSAITNASAGTPAAEHNNYEAIS
ncbi:MAG TPA: hypothetical protein VHQ22_07580, partial [Terriglobales bacterium]|nr:hypothetical protein [Terriglobales bacterium]